MQRYLLPFLIFLLASCTQISSSVSIVPIGDEMIVIAAPHGFEIFFDSGATHTARDLYISGSTVINGSYFGVTDSRAYYPAGLWRSGTDETSPAIFEDPNITHVVRISHSEPQRVTIFPNKDLLFMKWGGEDDAFQAGPLVLSGNTLQDFGDSWHARESHERTLIGQTASGKVYFFISGQQLSLSQIGEQIARDPRFQQDQITVLNLDGGPSTAYYDGTLAFRENKNLPIFIRINP